MAITADLLERHGAEFAFVINHFLTEHLARVARAFDGDLTAALVLGTIAHYNLRRFQLEVVERSSRSMDMMIAAKEYEPYLRPCNTLSVSASTGIPRETVRRKVDWLVRRGWVRRVGRQQLVVEGATSVEFADFNAETVKLFIAASDRVDAIGRRRTPSGARSRKRAAVR